MSEEEVPDVAPTESAKDWLGRVRPDLGNPPPKPTESAGDWLTRIRPDLAVGTPPSDIQQAAQNGLKIGPSKGARILNATAKSANQLTPDYVSRNLEQTEADNQRAKVIRDLSDPNKVPAGSVVPKYLTNDPVALGTFQNEIPKLVAVEAALKEAHSPGPANTALTPKETQEQAERRGRQRWEEWDNSYMTWLGRGTVDPEETKSDLIAQEIEKIRKQEEYIAGTGKTGFIDTFKKTHQDNPLWWAGMFSAVDNIERNHDINAATERLKSGKGTQADTEFLERERRYAQAKVARGEDVGGHFADIVSSVVPFMMGLGATKSIAQGVESGVMTKGSAALAGTLANPVVSGGLILASKGAGVASQVATAGFGNLIENYYQNKGESSESEALAKATVSGLIDYGSLHIPFNPVAKLMMKETGAIPTAESLLKRVVTGGLEGAASFLPTNEAQKLAKAATGSGPAYQLPSLDEVKAQLLAGGLLGSSHGYAEHAQAKYALGEATKVKEAMEAASETVKSLEAANKAPEAVQSAVKAMVPDSVTTVDPEAFQSYYQGQGVDPHAFADEVTGGTGSLQDALLDRHPLAIPTDAYITKIGATDAGKFFSDKIKLDPRKPSFEEATAHVDQVAKEVDEDIKARAEKKAQAKEPKQDVLDQPQMIAKNLRENLEAAGFKKSAKATSTLVESAFRRLSDYARESGIDPSEFLARFTPNINTESQAAPVEGSQYVKVMEQSGQIHVEQVKGATRAEALENAHSQWTDATIEPMTAEEVQHFLPIAMDRPESAVTLEQSGETEPRGRINIGKSSLSISLLKDADPSTFVHELGHLYLEAFGEIASNEKASEGAKGDYKTLTDWLGVKDRSEIGTEHHEKFARGFERYLMEGVAPSSKLRKVFDKFRVWLTDIYRNVKNLNVELTPEVRGVFDRLLASDEEIKKARDQAGGTEDFLDAPGITLSQKDHARRAELEAARDEAARSKVDDAALADIKRQQTKQYQHSRDMMEQVVTEEVNQRPEQQALSLLQKGEMPDGRKLPEGAQFKLDRNAIPKLFGDQYTGIDLSALPRGITAKEGGIHPDIAAEMLGFKSGKELIQALSGLDRNETIQKETNARMEAEVEKPAETLDQAAKEAIHNDKEAELKIFGLQWLAQNKLKEHQEIVKAVSDPVKYLKAVRDYANDKIDRTPSGKLDPTLYEAGEKNARKKAKEAALAGQYGEAFKWKDKELLNHELFRSATEAKREMKDSGQFKRFFDSDASLGKARDTDLVAAGRAILSTIGLGKPDKTADSYLSKIKAYDPDTYATLKTLIDATTEGAGTSQDQLTYGQWKAAKGAVDALWELSKRTKQFELAGRLVEREEATTAVGDRLKELDQSGGTQGQKKAITGWDRFKMYMLGARAAIRRAESWAESVGPVAKKYLTDPIFQATANYREAKKNNTKDYLDDVKTLDTASYKPRSIEAPELDYTFSGKSELVSAFLHEGNPSNLGKNLVGRGWGSRDAEGNLDRSKWDAFRTRMFQDGTITKADYDYIQKVWDRFDGLKAGAQKAHKDMYGFYFNEVTKEAVQTPWGEYKGGYVPAMADPFMSRDAAERSEKESLEKNSNSFMFPTTGRGFTKARSEGYATPLALGLEFLPAQFDKVLRFIHIEPHVKDVARVLFDKDFSKTLEKFDSEVRGDLLIPWLQRAAQQRIGEPPKGMAGRLVDNFCRELRTRSGMQLMVANVSNALQQTTGLFSTKLQVESIRDAMWDYARRPQEMSDDINEKSVYMRNRIGPKEMELRQTVDDLILNPSTYQKASDFAQKHGYFMQEGIQNIVDKVTWRSAYDEAAAKGMSDAEAVLHADSVVRQTQFSTNPEDISRIESGTAFVRMFTMFMSHYNRQLNLFITEGAKANQQESGALRRKAYIAFTGFILPALVAEGISKGISGDFNNDDDESYMTGISKFFFGSMFHSAVATVPVVGPLASSLVSKFTGSGQDDRLGTSPAISSVSGSLRAPHSVWKALEGEGRPSTAIRDVMTLVGLLTKTPLAPFGRPLGYMADVAHGDAEAKNPVQVLQGMLSGHGKERK